MKEKFIQFLKDEGMYESFVKWVVEMPYHYSNANHSSFDTYLDTQEPLWYFTEGFDWPVATKRFGIPESVWLSIANKWGNICEKS